MEYIKSKFYQNIGLLQNASNCFSACNSPKLKKSRAPAPPPPLLANPAYAHDVHWYGALLQVH